MLWLWRVFTRFKCLEFGLGGIAVEFFCKFLNGANNAGKAQHCHCPENSDIKCDVESWMIPFVHKGTYQ